jgi:hypothetical protein
MKRIFLILITIVLSYSCETDVTDDITLNGAPPRLVIEGGIERNTNNPVTTQRIRLTSTIGFLDEGDPNAVTNAQVTVNDGTTDFQFTHAGDGFYTNNAIAANINTTYTITVIWNGETYEGSDTLNEVAPFDDVYSEFEEETLITDEGYFVKFDSTDPVGVENFYYYKAFRNGEFIIVPDPGNSATLVESDEFFEIGDSATVQQLAITEEYYDFLFQLFEQTGNQVPIIGNPPPASIRSNVINTTTPSNRMLGFFYAVDIEEASLIVTE